MMESWTFGRKIGAGFAVVVALTAIVGAISIYALQNVVENKDKIIVENAQALIDAQGLSSLAAQRMGAALRFLLTEDGRRRDEMRELRAEMLANLNHLRTRTRSPDERRLIEDITRTEPELQAAIDRLVTLRATNPPVDALAAAFDDEIGPVRTSLRRMIDAFTDEETRLLSEARDASTRTASSAITLVAVVVVLLMFLAGAIALTLTRTLGRQIGTSINQVRSSSAELQASANQQATATREQATAMSEITTTITELLATSRQIAESAQRVAQIAEQTASGARAGDSTVGRSNEAAAAIRRQVDLIVSHMLDLGKKSQQIGSVLDIVSELAEQTNILAINATIEAAGAGEAGKRFAVVADEIRKLADRVGGSTKEVRALIDDVRGAVNATVMATETGAKAVDAGSKQFAEVAAAFREIGGLVTTTTEAARQIELSTKQQATAVEQVNIAVTNVAQSAKESEASSAQTLQTASQLSGLANDLLRLVDTNASRHAA